MKINLVILFCTISFLCFGQTEKDLLEADSCFFTFPETLSVNAEDKLWQISCNCTINEFKFVVYNRWGEKKYEAKSPDKSKFIPLDYSNFEKGIYVWVMECYLEDKGKIIQKNQTGYITCL